MNVTRYERSPTVTRYFSEIRRMPHLTREEEQVLARRIKKGSRDCRDRLVQANLGFVVKVASEYRHLGLPFEDLLNEGNVGLIEAANRYDATKGTKFITYAIWWIRKSIFKALSERSSLVRVPNYQMKRVREIRDTELSLRRSLGRKPDREEICAHLESSLTQIDQALRFNLRQVSLEHKVGKDNDIPLADLLADDEAPSAEADLIRREDSSLVADAVRELSDQEKTVLVHRFGLCGGGPRTLKEVGQLMKISRERVRQIECKAKGRLRRIFDARRAIPAPPKQPMEL